MYALDTNVLIRYITCDDPVQTERARAVIDKAGEEGERLFISNAVLCELVWVLRVGFKCNKDKIIEELRKIYTARQTSFTSDIQLRIAIKSYSEGKGDFADYLIRQDALEHGCKAVFTFDKDLLHEKGFIEP